MAETKETFAIRCPNCQKWHTWKKDPERKVIKNEKEAQDILVGLTKASSKQEQEYFDDPSEKLLRCPNNRWYCPASYEAFIFGNESEASKFSENAPDIWGTPRQFRLCKTEDLDDRWDKKNEKNYICVLFNSQPVLRRREIELELILKPEMISHLISGICEELNLPLTCYAANVFYPKGGDKDPVILWMPIEVYYKKKHEYPLPLYNHFCEITRKTVLDKIKENFNKDNSIQFEDENFGPDKCPFGYGDKEGKHCGGRDVDAACKRKDWNHCPAFIEERINEDPCYNSDIKLIDEIEKGLTQGDIKKREEIRNNGKSIICPAGFTEIAFPIITHGFLVGIAMTGQIFSKPNEIKDVGEFIKSKSFGKTRWKYLRDEEDKLEDAKTILKGYQLRHEGEEEARFMLSDETQKTRKNCLRSNRDRLEDVTESRYQDFRTKAEFFFRQELSGYIDNHKRDSDFFENAVLHVLKRMREFWAFKAVYLTRYSFKGKIISLIAKSVVGQGEKGHGYPGNERGPLELELKHLQLHPNPYLYCWGKEPDPKNPLFVKIVPEVNKIVEEDKKALELSSKDYIFSVFIPSYEEAYTFIFAIRNQDAICSLEHSERDSVSEFCQNIIFDVCGEIVYEFYNVQAYKLYQQELEKLQNEKEERIEQAKKECEKRRVEHSKQVNKVLDDIEVNLNEGTEVNKTDLESWIEDIRESEEDLKGE